MTTNNRSKKLSLKRERVTELAEVTQKSICNTRTIGDRIKQAREELGLTQEALAELIGISQQSLSEIESNQTLNPRNIERYAFVLRKTKEWIQFGDGTSDDVSYPIMSSCPILVWEDVSEWPKNKQKITQKEFELLSSLIILNPNSYAIKVMDDTMTRGISPSFPEGSFIIVDPDKEYKSGSYVIVSQKGTTDVIFRVYEKNFAGEEHLCALKNSSQPKYQPIKLKKEMKIVGVVIAVIGITL